MNDVSGTLKQHLAEMKNARACQTLKKKEFSVNYMEPAVSMEKA